MPPHVRYTHHELQDPTQSIISLPHSIPAVHESTDRLLATRFLPCPSFIAPLDYEKTRGACSLGVCSLCRTRAFGLTIALDLEGTATKGQAGSTHWLLS